jgi:beta-lactamase regulating signal transducer with metallopeptidase domain
MIDWLAGTLIATSLLMGLVLLVREPVRRHFGPAAAYGLWLIPVLRLVMPPLTTTVERTVAAATPLSVGASRPETLSAAGPSLIERLGGWETLALSAWLAGAGTMLLCGILIYRWQRREVLRDSVQVARLGKIRIVRSETVRGPMAFGILDKVVALPMDFDQSYGPRERRLAFDHELAHHRSGDLAVSHCAFVLLCLQWFNPLAWLSHAAFRFDQEAACDARVLDKVSSEHRGAYAHTIAKAASGRALLFAGALDRPGTLHRRLKSMFTRPSRGRRIAGKALIALTTAAALPLTASRATEYVDVPAPQNAAATTPDLKGVTLGKNDVAFFEDDTVLIGGERKRLDQLNGAERTRLKAVIVKSQADLVRERADLPRELAEMKQEADRARSGELRREHMRDLEDMRRDLAAIDSDAAELRASGEDPEQRKAEIRADLREAEAIDIASEEREAIEDGDPNKRIAELRFEELQMKRMLARLDQLDRR